MNRLVIVTLISIAQLAAVAPLNLQRAYSFAHHREHWDERVFRFGVNMEHSVSAHAYNGDEQYMSSPTHCYNQYESALAMLEGHAVGNTLHTLANIVGATQDGTRGTLEVTGDFEATVANCFLEYNMIGLAIPGNFSLYLGMPVGRIGFSNVSWKDRTRNGSDQDVITKEILTNNVQSFARNYGHLATDSYVYAGTGDLTAQIKWSHRYYQRNRNLKSVLLHARTGVLIPLGKEKSEDNAMEVGLSHDGAWGLPAGVGIELDLEGDVRIGVDVNALILSSNTKEWRLKTHRDQTDFLLLRKGVATRSYGPKWQFNLYGQYYGFDPRVVFTLGYQLYKNDEDTLYPQEEGFSTTVVNSAESREEMRSHNLVVHASYNAHTQNEGKFTPYAALQFKLPFGGQRAINLYTISCELGVQF